MIAMRRERMYKSRGGLRHIDLKTGGKKGGN